MPIFHLTNKDEISELAEIELSEEKLRTLFEKHGLVFIEKELTYIARNVPAGRGFIDTFAIDNQNRPVIIEYKVETDVTGDALAQSLAYADYVLNNQEKFSRYIIQHLPARKLTDEDIRFDELRIVIVAPSFLWHVCDAVRLVEPHIKLIKYRTYLAGKEKVSLVTDTIFDSFQYRRTPRALGEYSLDHHFCGGRSKMRLVFEKLQQKIKEKFNIEPHVRSGHIGFRRNYMFVVVFVYTNKLEIGLRIPKEYNPPIPPFYDAEGTFGSRPTHGITLEKLEDINEELLKWIQISYDHS